MKRIWISTLLILVCFKTLFAPTLNLYDENEKKQEIALICRLNQVLTEDLKDHVEFVEFEQFNRPSLEKAIHRILVIKAIALTETGLDLATYNTLTVKELVYEKKAFNEPEQAVGLLQIRPIMYTHIVKELKFCNYTIHDRWKADKSIRMFIAFQDYYNPDWNLERVSRDWNGGGGLGMRKNATIKYYNKFYSNYRKLQNIYF